MFNAYTALRSQIWTEPVKVIYDDGTRKYMKWEQKGGNQQKEKRGLKKNYTGIKMELQDFYLGCVRPQEEVSFKLQPWIQLSKQVTFK